MRLLSARRAVLPLLLTLFTALAASQVSVTTFHNDNYRTGWNNHETSLTPANVASASFAALHHVVLDDQVDGQPLVVPGVNITAGTHKGTHDVVYVVTEGNTIYAIDAKTGTILLSPNFGKAVPRPLGCTNNGPNVGINSTPVIDTTTSTMYVIVYTSEAGGPVYRIHALDLGSLSDKISPQLITASHALHDGSTFTFNALYQRQRPGLLQANGNIYAGFGSFCDFSANHSRGWLLGWTQDSLTPLAANQIFDTQPTGPNNFFLSSIWMSGYGLAADDSGNVLFVTGNSDYSGTTYDGVTNIQESVVKVAANLGAITGIFTPSNQASLDQSDADFGSGGLMVLPDQPGTRPHMGVAAGKYGTMYLMNIDHLGGYSPIHNDVLQQIPVGSCWCGPSYFVDSDGTASVVSSGARTAKVWKLATSPKPAFSRGPVSPVIPGGQFPGFFTSISSNGTSSPIIWALSHPQRSSAKNPIYLYAFDPDASSGGVMTQLFKGLAGNWPNTDGNSNLIAVVANGEVFVASNKQLVIFGLKAAQKK